jgi:hypothetical protein
MNHHFCQVDPEQLALADALVYKWPDPNLPWTLMDEVTGISYEDLKAAADAGLKGWTTCSGLKPVFTASARDARLLIYAVRIDGPGNVLADCQLPTPGLRQVKMRLDLSEDWLAKIKLPVVIRHEGGHGAGLGHAPGGSKNWMAPIYDPAIATAGTWDTNEMQGRYGSPLPTTPTLPPSIPGGGGFNMGGLLGLLVKLAPIIQWLIANKDSMAGLLDLLKKIADAFGGLPKPAGLVTENLIDRSAFRAFLMAQINALKAMAAFTANTWDDTAAKFLEEAANTEWLFNLVCDIFDGNIMVTEKMLENAKNA